MGEKFVKVKAKQEGTCGKCKAKFFQGHDIYVCKGKRPLCGTCGNKAQGSVGGPVVQAKQDPWDLFAGQALAGAVGVKGLPGTVKEAEDLAHKVAKLADLMMAEKGKRR